MKRAVCVLAFFGLQAVPILTCAGPLTIALELISFVIQVTPPSPPGVVQSSASVTLSNEAAVGDARQGFSGTAATFASIDIDRFAEAEARATAAWTAQFRVNVPGVDRVLLSASYADTTRAFSNFVGDSFGDIQLSVEFNGVTVLDDPFPERFVSCSTTFFSCERVDAGAEAVSLLYTYAFGDWFPVGTIFDISGSMFAHAFGDTGAGSAEGSGHGSVAFSIFAVPEPSSLTLVFIALMLVISFAQRARCMR